jgi:hypothetical protein
MYQIRNVPLAFDEAEYVGFRGERMARLLDRPGVRAQFEQAVEEVHAAAAPAAGWDFFPIEAFDGAGAVLEGGVRIGGGPFGRFMENAFEVAIVIATVGPEVDARIDATNRDGDAFTALLMDELANWAVDQTRQEVLRTIRRGAEAAGLHVGVPISPGQSGWSVRDQKVVFALLDGGALGVTLTPSMLMTPIKTVSTAVGIGMEPVGPMVEGKVPCDFCSLKERCRYSRAGQGAAV